MYSLLNWEGVGDSKVRGLMLSSNQNVFKLFDGALTKQLYALGLTGPSFFSV